MQLDGRRTSTHVDDRRGRSSTGKAVGGLGIGGILIAVVVMLLGGDPSDVINQMGGLQVINESGQVYTPSAEEEELAEFSSKIFAGTEDVWTRIFEQNGRTYDPPTLVLFTGSVQSGCGGATASSGPFYCSADQSVYIDLSFFSNMRKEFGTAGDFAYAYVIAHEVGHHVQALLGALGQAHSQMSRVSKTESNQISVRLELQADFYAGIWGYYDNKMFGSLEDGDIEEALAIAARIGDDYLQKKAYGRTVPESFNHGTSEQRSRWLKKGLTTGDLSKGDSFSPAYQNL